MSDTLIKTGKICLIVLLGIKNLLEINDRISNIFLLNNEKHYIIKIR